MTKTAYQKALKSYQKNADDALSPMQIVVELYKGMIKNIQAAKSSWSAGQLELMTNHITKVFDIIEALQSNLDMEKGGEDAKFLNRFYNVVFSAMSNATMKPDPAREFDAIASYVQDVYVRWYNMAYGKPAEAEAAAR